MRQLLISENHGLYSVKLGGGGVGTGASLATALGRAFGSFKGTPDPSGQTLLELEDLFLSPATIGKDSDRIQRGELSG